MDADAHAQQLIESGATTEEAIRGLRTAGFTRMVSASALLKATRMGYPEVLRAVVAGSVWADQRGSLDDWIAPPEPPDAGIVDRLRDLFQAEPRVAEAWIRGIRSVLPDGTLSETTGVAFVLEPPLREDIDAESDFFGELVAELRRCWPLPPDGQRGYDTVTREVLEAHSEYCLQVFTRAPGA